MKTWAISLLAVGSPVAIGLDVGGTKILSGLVDRSGNVLARHEIPSPDGGESDVLAALDEAVAALLDDRVAAIGYGVPANLERDSGRVLWATNLALDDVDLAGRARERFGLPVGIENDAAAATLAEWAVGAGRGTANLVLLTLGTGVGGGVVLGGRLLRAWVEVGHVVVQQDGPECACGGHGHLEVLASGSAADLVARELYGGEADAHLLVERAREGEEQAVTALARMGGSLGAAIGSLANLFDPELVVVGGGFGAAAGELLLVPARNGASAEAIPPADQGLRIVAAQLGPDAGLVGAGLVAFEALDGAR